MNEQEMAWKAVKDYGTYWYNKGAKEMLVAITLGMLASAGIMVASELWRDRKEKEKEKQN